MVAVGTAQEAQMVEKIGFSSILIAGSKTSAVIHGLPDAGLITLTEAVGNVERICNAVSIPVLWTATQVLAMLSMSVEL